MADRFDQDVILSAFRAAAFDASRWKDALDVLSEETRSFGAFFIPIKADSSRFISLPHTDSLDDVYTSYWKNGWYGRDERYKAVPYILQRGVGTDLDFQSNDAIRKHPYWQDWLAPYGLKWFAGMRVAFGEDQWCLSVQRLDRQGPVVGEEIRRFSELANRLSAYGTIAGALSFARLDGVMHAFETSRRPIIILDRWGKVVRINPRAERLLGSDIQITNGTIQIRDASSRTRMREALRSVVDCSLSSRTEDVVRISRAGLPSLLAYISSLPRDVSDVFGNSFYSITLIDPLRKIHVNRDALAALYGLSNAEVKLVSSISEGFTLRQSAERLGISYETARTSLKGIFFKMEVNSQSDAISRVLLISEQC